jgi:hypothetical protein
MKHRWGRCKEMFNDSVVINDGQFSLAYPKCTTVNASKRWLDKGW